MGTFQIVGLDPSLNNFGMVRGNLDLHTGVFSILYLVLQETASKTSSNKTVRKNSQDLNRARHLHKGLHAVLMGADMVMVEIPVGSQTARAMASYGICIGLIASINKPMIQVTPSEVKMAACGSKTASKAEMINWAITTYPSANWLTKKVKGLVTYVNKNEHLADAVAAVHAGVLTDEFIQARSLLIKG